MRSHLPLAAVSLLSLVLFMTLPAFDPLSYPRSDMGSPAALPQSAGGMGPMAHAASPMPARATHDAGGAPPLGHIAERAGSSGPGAAADGQARSVTQLFTVATGYVATGLLGLTLLVGPANLLLRRRNPVSSYLRRDAGIWTAMFSLIHVAYGSLLHSGGQLDGVLRYFFEPDGRPRLNSFGLGNWTGLAATVIVVGLLAISSDIALRTLKAGRWKSLQRLNYALFALVVAHAFFYGALLRVSSPFTVLLILGVVTVFSGQLTGVWLWRRRLAARAQP